MKILITGANGFIGANLTQRLLDAGHTVIGFGWTERLKPFQYFHNENYTFISGDIRNSSDYQFPQVDVIYHLAANTGITRGLANPYGDFETNTIATVKLLEWARNNGKPLFVYPSSNKVYPLEKKSRTPYGASKHTAEIWCMEYAHTFKVPSVVLRQSCIYGPRQYGYKEQGWIAWFMRANMMGYPIEIYGDGSQKRDILYVDDLVDFYMMLLTHTEMYNTVYDIGGGKDNVVSVNEVINYIEQNNMPFIEKKYTGERVADQKTYITDLSNISYWTPKTSKDEGLRKTFDWIKEHYEI